MKKGRRLEPAPFPFSAVGLPLFLRSLYQASENGPCETTNGSDHERGNPDGWIGISLGSIFEVRCDLRTDHTGQTVGNEDVSVVEPHVLVAEIVRRGSRN